MKKRLIFVWTIKAVYWKVQHKGHLLILRIQFSVCSLLISPICRNENKQRSNMYSSSQNSPPENHRFQHIDDSASRHKVVSAYYCLQCLNSANNDIFHN